MENELDLNSIFSENGICRNDTVVLHIDAGVASQYKNISNENKINHLISELKNFFNDSGTLLVPAFSYSFTENEEYDVMRSVSKVGLFSEDFRKSEGVARSEHPIFSMSIYGKNQEKYLNSNNNDCFGPKTSFDILYHENAKIVCLGCSLDRATFVHYSEQANEVSYRYLKNFSGKVINEMNQQYQITTSYFVRDLGIRSSTSLKLLIKDATKKNKIIKGSFGRFPLTVITCQDFHDIASELISKNELSLIEEGNNEI